MEVLVCFIFVFISISAALFLLQRTSRRRRLRIPPGKLGLPFIGETLQLISAYKTDNPEPFIDNRVNRFGPIFKTHIFGEPTVFSADPETNRFILQNEGRLFEVSYPDSVANLLGKHSLVLMKGPLHRRMHSLTMSFANSPIIKDHLFADIDRLVRVNLISWSDRIFLLEEAKKITFEFSMKQLMSLDPCEWTESLRKEYLLVVDGFFSLPSPLLSTTYRRAIKARTKVAEQLSLVVRQRRMESEKAAGGNVKKNNDMLAALLAAGDKLSDEERVEFLVALLIAGYETTSTSMTLAVKFLTETPLALAQLKKEHEAIRAKKGANESLGWIDYKSMPFTQCVINETLRVANITSGVFRRAMTDVNVKGYTIPKGWKVFASFRAVHLDSNYFKDARSFNPWRWQKSTEVSCPLDLFTPFGGGPRLCPGYELARVALAVFLHHFVTLFSWVPAEEDKLVFFPTTRTQKRYPIIVQRLHNA